MAKTVFGSPDATRVTLPDGEWVEFKTDTTVGDVKKIRRMLAPYRQVDQKDDPVLFRHAYILAHIVEWSFRDAQGQPVPVSLDAYDELRSSVASDVGDALDALQEEKEKNETSGETKPEPSSPSAD